MRQSKPYTHLCATISGTYELTMGSYAAMLAQKSADRAGDIGAFGAAQSPRQRLLFRHQPTKNQFSKRLEFYVARLPAIYDFGGDQVVPHSMCAKMCIAEFTVFAGPFIQSPIQNQPIGHPLAIFRAYVPAGHLRWPPVISCARSYGSPALGIWGDRIPGEHNRKALGPPRLAQPRHS